MQNIIGIDLGTTNSEIAIIKDEQPCIIPIDGDNFMPSCVGIDDQGKLLVGRPARNQMILRPESTILSVKRLMGENTTMLMGGSSFTPTEISALILKELKKYAEEFLGESVTEAVITVPAYFDDHQRKATRDAGKLAGLEVKRIINEPTAAALAYDVEQHQNQTILVYDLGGGTFDVSLVVIEEGIVAVKASHGDTHLGGDDFDNLLIDHIAEDFMNRHSIDLRRDPRTRNRLRQAAEKAKIELSSQPYTTILEEFITENLHLEIEISRHDYEMMIQPLISKTLISINKCLSDAGLLPEALDQIILVGGSSRTPLVRTRLENLFNITVHNEINPDLIVAMGAAIQGGILTGCKSRGILVDITPYSFGTCSHDNCGIFNPGIGRFVPIIKRNTPLPARKSEVFYTVVDNQEMVDVKIFQGDEPIAEDNILVGNFLIENLSKKPQNNPIIIEIKLDLNGILEVTATEKVSGLSKTVRMSSVDSTSAENFAESQQKLSQLENNCEEILALMDDAAAETGSTPLNADQHLQLLNHAKSLRQRAEKISDRLDEDDQSEINTLLNEVKESIKNSAWEELEQTCESLSDILFYLED